MAIFAETDLRSAFDGILPLLSQGDAKQMLGRLRAKTAKDTLSAEWEVVLMNAIRNCGKIEIGHLLKSTSGESRPDVFFRSSEDGPLALLPPCYIEISAISDDGYEADNPQGNFIDAFKRLVSRVGLPMQHFRVDVRGAIQDKTEEKRIAEAASGKSFNGPIDWDKWFRGNRFNDRKMRLALPPKNQVDQLVNAVVAEKLKSVSREPLRPHSIPIHENGILIDIDFDPRRSNFSYGHPSYTTAYSLEHNPVANRLNKKRKQVKKGSAIRGIILCDRGCDLLADRGYPGPEGFRLRDIVTDVLSRRPEISFVVIYAINQKVNGWGYYEGLQLSVSAFYNPQKAAFPIQSSLLGVALN